METVDDSSEDLLGLKPRKKVERNTSAPLPGMLQVSVQCRVCTYSEFIWPVDLVMFIQMTEYMMVSILGSFA